jgi:hypothetical protein
MRREGGYITLLNVNTHVIDACHSGPWLSFRQAKIEALPIGDGHSIQMQEATFEQFIDALHVLIVRSCIDLSYGKKSMRTRKIQKLMEELDGDDTEDLDMFQRWYLMEELEHLGVVFATTAERKGKRKYNRIIPRPE